MLAEILMIVVLIAISAFLSISEISLATANKLRLNKLVEEGSANASRVLALQQQPGNFFTVVQIGLNAVAILGGIVGEAAFTPYIATVLRPILDEPLLSNVSFWCSFFIVISGFILFADLIPKRLGLLLPEHVAVRIVRPMLWLVKLLSPFIWAFNSLANMVLKILGAPQTRNEQITSDDILAVMSAGAQAGVFKKEEQNLIENMFELESRYVPSAMTHRDSIIYLDVHDSDAAIRQVISNDTHSKFLVCDGSIDSVVGYVCSKDILKRVLNQQPIDLSDKSLVKTPLTIPDYLSLSEALDVFKLYKEDYAVIFNEYALVVGVITLNDVMNTLMGDLVMQQEDDQIIQRDKDTWLIDGVTPIEDVMRVLNIAEFPHSSNYETISGFIMYMLRKIPKRTDYVSFAGYKFEVVDIDQFKIDQLLVSRIASDPNSSRLTE